VAVSLGVEDKDMSQNVMKAAAAAAAAAAKEQKELCRLGTSTC
jgi:hypothetical protein